LTPGGSTDPDRSKKVDRPIDRPIDRSKKVGSIEGESRFPHDVVGEMRLVVGEMRLVVGETRLVVCL
jgi:hypothetical protein